MTYTCISRDTRIIGKGVKAAYDGECVRLPEHKGWQLAITAYPGEKFAVDCRGEIRVRQIGGEQT